MRNRNRDVAVIGMACRFPGGEGPDGFWELLAGGGNAIREIPPERWDNARYFSDQRDAVNTSVSKWGGLIDGADNFDHRFFNISPREAGSMDPQQRLLLQESWHCLEHSGVPLTTLQQRITSVYAGVMAVDYRQSTAGPDVIWDGFGTLGSFEGMLANRISHQFDLRGTSLSINAACASFLVAVHEAKQSLLAGDSDFALVCAANLNLHPWKYVSFSKLRMLSPNGQCRTFDKEADGYVPGDGIAAVLLQREDQARKDGNTVHGIIRGSAVNHNGRRSPSLVAPSVESQREVILAAYADAGLSPQQATYTEAHGTGTSLGDPIEVEALRQVFNQSPQGSQSCVIGSVKSNIGHLEAASGAAGMIKLLMMMKHRQIPPSLNIAQVNPMLALERTPFALADTLRRWEPDAAGEPLRAGLSSFGFGGVNAHIIMEEYTEPQLKKVTNTGEVQENGVIVFSAKSAESLNRQLQTWRDWLATGNISIALRDVSGTLVNGRGSFSVRAGFMAASLQDVEVGLDEWLAAEQPFGEGKGNFSLIISDLTASVLARIKEAVQQGPRKKQAAQLMKLAQRAGCERGQAEEFVYGYGYLKMLEDAGFRPFSLLGEGKGRWTGLALSEMATPEQVLELMGQGRAAAGHLKWSRPVVPLSLQGMENPLEVYGFAEEYIRQMAGIADELSAPDSEWRADFELKLDKSRKLLTSQHTFKKYMEEWRTALYSASGEDLWEWLETPGSRQDRSGQAIVYLSVTDSLHKLNRKWSFVEPEVCTDPRLQDWEELLSGLISREQAISLFLEKEPDYAAIASELQTRWSRSNEVQSYPYARQQLFDAEGLLDCLYADSAGGAVPGKDLSGTGHLVTLGKSSVTGRTMLELGAGEQLAELYRQDLLGLWLRGADIDWMLCYPEGSYRKLALPGYCFAGQSFGLAAKHLRVQDQELPAESPSALAGGERSEVQAEELFYDSCHPLVRDHRIGDRHLLPGACMIRAALNTVELEEHRPAVQMERILLQKPAVPGPDGEIRLRSKWNSPEFCIMAGDETICKGRARAIAEAGNAQTIGAFVLNGEGISAESLYSGKQLYESLELAGYGYGESLRVMTSGGADAAGNWQFELRAVCDFHGSDGLLDEALLDGVFQAMLAAGFLSSTLAEETHVYVPCIITSLKVLGPLAGPGSFKVNIRNQRAVNGNYFASASVFDSESRMILDADEVMFRYGGLYSRHHSAAESAYSYERYWRKEELGPAGVSTAGRLALLLAAATPFDSQLRNQLLQNYEQVYSFSASQGLSRVGGDEAAKEEAVHSQLTVPLPYSANPEAASSYTGMLAELSRRFGPLSGRMDIYYLPSWDTNAQPEDWPDQLERGVLGLFHLAQALVRAKAFKIRLIAAVSGVQTLTLEPQEKGAGFAYGAMDGFIRSIAREHPGLVMKIVDLDVKASVSAPELLMAECLSSTGPEWAVYKGNERFVAAFQPQQPGAVTSGPVFKGRKVYLIAGGAGGIGLQLLYYLRGLDKELCLAVLGRSELSGDRRTQWEAAFADDPNLLYIRCDITDQQELREAVSRVHDSFGPIHGVFQAAGILADGLLAGKSRASFKEVLGVKTAGTWNLDRLTCGEPLDFFVVFSSVVSVIGNAGQSDYAAANAFLDAFIHYRAAGLHPGKSLSIGWTLWEEGGMGRTSGHRDIFASRAGILPTSTALGMLEPLIGADASQFAVVGDAQAFESQFPKFEAGVDKMAVDQSQIQAALMRLLSNIIQVPETEFDADTDLREYGLESVLLTELSEQIGAYYGVSLNPTLFFEYPDIRSLARYLSERYNLTAPAAQSRPKGTEPQPEQVSAGTFSGTKGTQAGPDICGQRAEGEAGHTSSERKIRREDIAIIGMTGRFPGAEDLDEYQSNLEAGKCAVTEIPGDRWDWREAYGDPSGNADKTRSKWGGLLRDIRSFDAEFFRISRREAELMDPQQRLLLEEAWRVLESAGYAPSSLRGSDTGVFIGICNDDYNDLLVREGVRQDAYSSTGTFFALAANRISFVFDWHGPSVSVDTACSSSLVALHQAVQSIHNGDCSMAVAGGVNICCSPKKHFSFDNAGMLSADGRCKTFDEDADGYVRGEGLGLLLLKPLNQAVTDGDLIYGVIKGSAVNHGGKANSLTAPNPVAQAKLLISAFSKAGIHPSTVGYVEAHGTGTSLGDPIEINGLKKAFQDLYAQSGAKVPDEPHCVIGSVKPSIGHLESAAGIAGVIKVLLAMQSGMLGGMKHIRRLNPYIELVDSPFLISTEDREWRRLREPNGELAPRRAGISSFGFGGVNAHVVLEQYEPEARLPQVEAALPQPELLLLSAGTEASLIEAASSLARYLRTADSAAQQSDNCNEPRTKATLSGIAYTLQTGRDAMEERLGLIVRNMREAAEALEDVAMGWKPKVPFYRNHVELSGGRRGQSAAAPQQESGLQQDMGTNDKAVSESEWMRLASLWISGEFVDWRKYYPEIKPDKAALPTYRFLGETYWLPSSSDSSEPGYGQPEESSDVLLTNWKILDAALQAERKRDSKLMGRTSVSGVRWAQPYSSVPEKTDLDVSLYSYGTGTEFEVVTGAGEEEVLCQGTIHEQDLRAGGPYREDVQQLSGICSSSLQIEKLRGQKPDRLDYGSSGSWSSIRYSEEAGSEALLHFRFDRQTAPEPGRRMATLLEEIMLVVNLIRGRLHRKGKTDRDTGYLCPFGIEYFDIYRDIDIECIIYVNFRRQNIGSEDPVELDLQIMDTNGECSAIIRGLTAYECRINEHTNQLVEG